MFWRKLFGKVSKEGVCHMCDQTFPDKILVQSGEYFFCAVHAKFYEDHSWIELFKVSATNDNFDNALLVQDTKDRLKASNINSIIQTNYREKNQSIESVFSLLVATDEYNQSKQFLLKP